MEPTPNALIPVKPSPPPLIWANGRPIERAQLTGEISAPTMTGVRSVMSGHPAQGLTPARLGSLLREAEQGNAIRYLELAEEMEEKDLHYLGVMGTRKRAVAQLPIKVVAASDSPQDKDDAKLIEDWLDRDMLESELFEILDAVGKGYSATEIIWEITDGVLLPGKLKGRDPRWFVFDTIDGETLRLWTEDGPADLPPAKFIVHTANAKSGIPIRGGLARAVSWGWMFKNYGIKDWLSFLEMFGLPMRVGRYDNGATEGDIRKLMQAVAQLGSDAAACFPKTMEIEFIDGKTGAAPNDLWRSLAEYIDEQVSKAVLGQTSSSDAKAGGLGSGQANLHNDVRGDIERADANQLAATLNRDLVPPMIALNRGPRARYPRIKIGRPEPVDVEAMTRAAHILVPMGVRVSADAMRDQAGLPAPQDGEEVLTAPAAAPAQLPGQEAPGGGDGPLPPKMPGTRFLYPLKSPLKAVSSGTKTPVAPEPDAIDRAADEALGDWEKMIAAMLTPIDALIDGASNLSDVRDGLVASLASMEAGELTELLARAGFGSRLAGDVDVGTEQTA